MVTNNISKNTLIGTGSLESAKMGLANERLALELLSTRLYSNPTATTIREYLSNCYDANVDAGNANAPIMMTIRKNEMGQWYVAFTDFGTGMSSDKVLEVFAQYGASDKTENPDQLGMLGLGSKSAFSYVLNQKCFFVKSVLDGFETEYMLAKNDESATGQSVYITKPPIETDKPNGVSVWFYLEQNDSFEASNFAEEARKHAAFFPNVIFDFDMSLDILNTPSITNYGYFSVSSNLRGKEEAFFLLGKVIYPIDWVKLGFNQINLPIGINIGLSDGVEPAPTRENLLYSPKTIEVLREKIKNTCLFLIDNINKQSKQKTWFDYFKIKEVARVVVLNTTSWSLGTTDIKVLQNNTDNTKSVIPYYNGEFEPIFKNARRAKEKDFKEFTEFFTPFKQVYANGDSVGAKKLSWKELIVFYESGRVYLVKEKGLSSIKSMYIAEQLGESKSFLTIKWNNKINFTDYLVGLFQHSYDVKKYTDEDYEGVKNFIKEFIASIPVYDEVEVPQEYIAANKKPRVSSGTRKPRVKQLKTDIVLYTTSAKLRGSGHKLHKNVRSSTFFEDNSDINYIHFEESQINYYLVQHLQAFLHENDIYDVAFVTFENAGAITASNFFTFQQLLDGELDFVNAAFVKYFTRRKYFNDVASLYKIEKVIGSAFIKDKYEKLYDGPNLHYSLADKMMKSKIYDLFKETAEHEELEKWSAALKDERNDVYFQTLTYFSGYASDDFKKEVLALKNIQFYI